MSDKQQRADGTPAPDCSASDELRRVKREIGEVMAVLEGMSMGGIGSCGPTIWELDGHILEHGQPIENNADYHTAQLAWRRLQKIIEPNIHASPSGV